MICVIFRCKLEIPEEGYNVLDVVLDAKQFWYIVYALPIGDFNVLVRLVIQIIYMSWNRNIKRKKYLIILSFGFTSKLSTLSKITALIRPSRLRVTIFSESIQFLCLAVNFGKYSKVCLKSKYTIAKVLNLGQKNMFLSFANLAKIKAKTAANKQKCNVFSKKAIHSVQKP